MQAIESCVWKICVIIVGLNTRTRGRGRGIGIGIGRAVSIIGDQRRIDTH